MKPSFAESRAACSVSWIIQILWLSPSAVWSPEAEPCVPSKALVCVSAVDCCVVAVLWVALLSPHAVSMDAVITAARRMDAVFCIINSPLLVYFNAQTYECVSAH